MLTIMCLVFIFKNSSTKITFDTYKLYFQAMNFQCSSKFQLINFTIIKMLMFMLSLSFLNFTFCRLTQYIWWLEFWGGNSSQHRFVHDVSGLGPCVPELISTCLCWMWWGWGPIRWQMSGDLHIYMFCRSAWEQLDRCIICRREHLGKCQTRQLSYPSFENV